MSTIDIHFDKKIDNSRIRRDADSLCSLEYLGLTMLGAVFVIGALFYGWQQYQWIQYGYRIEAAQTQIEELRETGRRLTVDRGFLASPQRIDETARRDLGMVLPGADQLVTVEANYSVPVEATGLITTQLAQRIDN
jgi:cell division protein FtsL